MEPNILSDTSRLDTETAKKAIPAIDSFRSNR